MKEYTSPEQILQIPTERLSQLLKKVSRGRFTETKAKELKALAANSFAARAFIRDANSFNPSNA